MVNIMGHDFTIRVTIRTATGFEPLCDFYLGNKRSIAQSIFTQLEGNDEVRESDILQVDLREINDGLPLDVKIKHCTLAQLSRSCSLITKELFKYYNLVQGG